VGIQFYLNFNTRELTCREFLREEYEVIVTDNDLDFNWTISDETKKIGKYTCYKAITKNFRGRNYEVWFTYDIPVPNGPWKFHGLPGLIMEVHDDKDLVNITFNSIKEKTDKEVDYTKPTSKDNILKFDEYLSENFRMYVSFVENQKAMVATGQMMKSIPLSYFNLQYNDEQIKLLNQYNEIEYSTYEDFIKDKN